MRACSGVRKEWATRTWVAQVRKKTTRLVIQPAVYKKSMESMSRGATTALPSEDANLRNHWGSIAWLEPCPIDPPSRQTLADAGRQHQIGLAKFLDDLGFHVPNAAAVATPKHVCRTAYLS